MKRSTQVSLVLLAGVSAVASLSGCGEMPSEQIPDNGGTFTSMAECVAVYDQQTCSAAQQLAQKEHVQNAPHFNSLQSCIAEYGADMCRPASSYGGSSNVFLPLMAGYMLGSATSTPAPLYYGSRRDRDRYHYAGGASPIFTSGRGYNRKAPIGAAPFQSQKSSISTSKGGLKSSTAISTGTVPSQRGGFGGSFKPTQSFKSNYSATNPSSFGRAALPASSARAVSISSSRGYARSSVSSRGGFGASGRSFGGGFGG